MGSIHSITLPAGYGHSLYGVPMGSIHCITLPAGYGHSLYGMPMRSIYCITLTAGYVLYTCTTPYMECQWVLYNV